MHEYGLVSTAYDRHSDEVSHKGFIDSPLTKTAREELPGTRPVSIMYWFQ